MAIVVEQDCDDVHVYFTQLNRLRKFSLIGLAKFKPDSFEQCQSACRRWPASLHVATHDGRTLAGDCDSRRAWDRFESRTYTQLAGARLLLSPGCTPRARASQQTEAGSGRGSILAPVGRGPRKSGSSPRRCRGTAPDTKHDQTAWRPPVSFLPAPASRRPRTTHRPIRYMPLPRERESSRS